MPQCVFFVRKFTLLERSKKYGVYRQLTFRFIYLFLVICCHGKLCANERDLHLDELLQKAHISKRIDSYISVCSYLSEIEQYPSLLLQYADSIHQLAIRDNNKEGLMEYYSFKAEAYFMQGNFDEGFKWKKKAFLLAETETNANKFVQYASDLGYYYNVSASYDSARYYILHGIETAKDNSLLSEQYRVLLTNYASSYIYEGETDSALLYVHQAERQSALSGDTAMWLENLNQLGTLYRRKKQMDISIMNFEKALQLCERQQKFRLASFIYGNIATVYCDWNRPLDAIPFSRKALEYAQKYGTPQMIGIFYLNLGAIQCKIPGATSEAVESLQQSLPLLEQVNNKRRLCESYSYLVNLYLQLRQLDHAESFLNKLDLLSDELKTNVEMYRYYQAKASFLKAKSQPLEALKFYQRLVDMQYEGYRDLKDYECYLAMSQCCEQLQQNQQALFYLNKAYVLRDSLFQYEHTAQLSDFSVKYKTQEKELEIAHLQERALQRKAELLQSRIVAGTILALLMVVVLILLYLRQRQRVRLARMAQAASEKEQQFILLQKDTEQRLTKKYIEGLESERERMATELHDDMCNSLLAITMNLGGMFAEEQNPEMKKQLLLLEKARERLRNMSHELMPPAFQYATIDEMLSDYTLHLVVPSTTCIEYKSTHGVDWNFVPKEIVLEFYRIVQESLSNAVKYAQASHIWVELSWKSGILSVRIEDDGKGFELMKVRKGIGLRTIQQRAESIGAILKCQSKLGAGTCLQVEVEINKR